MLECKFCKKICKNENSLRNHERLCKLNPDRQKSFFENRDIIQKMRDDGKIPSSNQYIKAAKLGLPKPETTEETRKKQSQKATLNNLSRDKEIYDRVSISMKKAHSEGRAWNIGKSRWKNLPSYPETFFMQVIENEFLDKNYTREYPLSIYSLDFAWEHKKKCIEIDGDQHQRFEEYKERDKRKNDCIKKHGWEILRISWKDMFNDTKHYIKIAKEFIDN